MLPVEQSQVEFAAERAETSAEAYVGLPLPHMLRNTPRDLLRAAVCGGPGRRHKLENTPWDLWRAPA